MAHEEEIHLPQREGDGMFAFLRTHWAYGLLVWPVLLYGNVVQGDILAWLFKGIGNELRIIATAG